MMDRKLRGVQEFQNMYVTIKKIILELIKNKEKDIDNTKMGHYTNERSCAG